MKAIQIEGMNRMMARPGEKDGGTPVRVNEKAGSIISCWKGNLRDRIHMLIRGRVYVTLLPPSKDQDSIYVSTHNPINKGEETPWRN